MSYKWCVVPECKNTSIKTPHKLFVCVPKKAKVRKKWLELALRNPNSIVADSVIFFCEDHFNIQTDMANYRQYTMGFSQRIIMVNGVMPSKFSCQQDLRKIICDPGPSQSQSQSFLKWQKMNLIEPTATVNESYIENFSRCTTMGLIKKEPIDDLPDSCNDTSDVVRGSRTIQESEDTNRILEVNIKCEIEFDIPQYNPECDSDVTSVNVTDNMFKTETEEVQCRSEKTRGANTKVINRDELNEDIKAFTCEHCRKKFHSKKVLQKHIFTLHCNLLSRSVASVNCNVDQYDSQAHQAVERCAQKKQNQQCQEKYLRKHIFKERPYKCDVCNKSFANFKNFTKHRRLHTAVKPYKCVICDKRFFQLKNLNAHEKSHTGEEMDVEVSVDVSKAAPSSSKQSSTTELINRDKVQETTDVWMLLGDSDMEVDDDSIARLSAASARNASAEPAAEQDMTLMEKHVLANEDRLNEHAIREFAPTDCYNFEWTHDRQAFLGQRETFTGKTGPTFPVTEHTRSVDIFHQMLDCDFIDLLCTETNSYARRKIDLLKQNDKLQSNSRLHSWASTDRDEMVSFLALTILQGLYPLLTEAEYFSFNGFGTMPHFRKVMSYNRYRFLRSVLHFANNSSSTQNDKLCKIQPQIDYFNFKFSSLYNPSRELVVDESLLKWRGRLGFAQKIISKTQDGVKTYELSESSTGYLWRFFVDAGRGNTTDVTTETTSNIAFVTPSDADNELEGDPEEVNYSTTSAVKILYDLVKPLLHRGHTLIMDSFYNSPLLARSLKRQQTDCYGTVRLSREFIPTSLLKAELRQGEVVASYCPDLSMMVWRNANLVSMISTYHNLQEGSRDKYNKLTYQPSIVQDYNKSLRRVGLKDQFLSAHPIERAKSQVWYKKMFFRMFNAAVFNCFVIFATSNKITHRQFRTMLAEDLLKIHRQIDLASEQRLTLRPGGQAGVRPQLEHRHFPVPSGFKQSRCWWCAQSKKVTRTVWKCLECNVNLCIEDCFMRFHI